MDNVLNLRPLHSESEIKSMAQRSFCFVAGDNGLRTTAANFLRRRILKDKPSA